MLNLRRGDWEPLEPAGQKYRWPLGLETGVGGGGSLVGLSPRARGIWHSLQVGSVGGGELVGGGKPPGPHGLLHSFIIEAEVSCMVCCMKQNKTGGRGR